MHMIVIVLWFLHLASFGVLYLLFSHLQKVNSILSLTDSLIVTVIKLETWTVCWGMRIHGDPHCSTNVHQHAQIKPIWPSEQTYSKRTVGDQCLETIIQSCIQQSFTIHPLTSIDFQMGHALTSERKSLRSVASEGDKYWLQSTHALKHIKIKCGTFKTALASNESSFIVYWLQTDRKRQTAIHQVSDMWYKSSKKKKVAHWCLLRETAESWKFLFYYFLYLLHY